MWRAITGEAGTRLQRPWVPTCWLGRLAGRASSPRLQDCTISPVLSVALLGLFPAVPQFPPIM